MTVRPSLWTSRAPRRRGAAIIYAVVGMSVLIGICSLAVDYGKAQLVRSELQAAADGAARAAASGLGAGAAEAKRRARELAGMNRAEGAPVTLADADFRFGKWDADAEAINTNGTPIDAVEVTARRTVSLTFGAMIGKDTASVSARATARSGAGSSAGYAIIGLDSITMSGNVEVDSFDSSLGPYAPGNRRNNADVATNGHIGLDGNAKIYGDATYGTGMTVSGNARVVFPGEATKATSPLSYPPPTLPATYTDMGKFNGSGNNALTLTSGNYYFTSFTTSGNFKLNIIGQVNVYVDGSFDMSGNMAVQGDKAGNFRVNMLSGAAVNISGNSVLYADVYAPNSPVNLHGNGDLFGRFVGKSISASGNGKIHYDESLAGSGGGGGGGITLVR